jgi:hypothetical protein
MVVVVETAITCRTRCDDSGVDGDDGADGPDGADGIYGADSADSIDGIGAVDRVDGVDGVDDADDADCISGMDDLQKQVTTPCLPRNTIMVLSNTIGAKVVFVRCNRLHGHTRKRYMLPAVQLQATGMYKHTHTHTHTHAHTHTHNHTHTQ